MTALLLVAAGYIESSSYGGKLTMLDMFEGEGAKRAPGDLMLGSQWALPDLNCKPQIPVALPDLNREPQIAVGTAGPQPRAPDPNGHCRTSKECFFAMRASLLDENPLPALQAHWRENMSLAVRDMLVREGKSLQLSLSGSSTSKLSRPLGEVVKFTNCIQILEAGVLAIFLARKNDAFIVIRLRVKEFQESFRTGKVEPAEKGFKAFVDMRDTDGCDELGDVTFMTVKLSMEKPKSGEVSGDKSGLGTWKMYSLDESSALRQMMAKKIILSRTGWGGDIKLKTPSQVYILILLWARVSTHPDCMQHRHSQQVA
eukprot:s3991_g9.t1